MATTTNFGWETPDDTDLVKDGAAAIRTALGGVDTSFIDLKGGTSGQILSKASNTDLDYTWVTTDDANAIQNAIVDAKGDLIAATAADVPARLGVGTDGQILSADSTAATGLKWITNDIGDITSVGVTSPITGGGTSGAVTIAIQDATTAQKGAVQLSDSTSTTSSILASTPTAVKSAYDLAAAAIPKSTVTAKGSIVAATASSTPANLAVGNNGETLVADSTTTTGLRWQAPVNANPILNSAMQVWQRGTSVAVAANTPTYTADRWMMFPSGLNLASTVSRQVTGDTTNLPNIQYCSRVQRNSGQTGTSPIYFSNSFETVNSIAYAGKTVILSYYARAGANYSSASNALMATVLTGTGTDQNGISSAYTGSATAGTATATLTTTWQRFTVSATIASTATEICTYFNYTPSGTAGANDYFEVTGVMLEVGSVVTSFKTYGSTIQQELAACQRYYYRNTFDSAPSRLGVGFNNSTTETFVTFPFPVVLRIRPTAFEQSGTAGDYSVITAGPTVTVCSAIPILDVSNVFQAVTKFTVASGLTSGAGAFFRNVNTNAYLGWSAEL